MNFCKTFLQMARYALLAAALTLAIQAIWHGWQIEIGRPGGGFHARLYQEPMKRFFRN